MDDLATMLFIAPQVKTRPLCVSTSPCSLRRRGQCVEAPLHRTNQDLGSSISLQVLQVPEVGLQVPVSGPTGSGHVTRSRTRTG